MSDQANLQSFRKRSKDDLWVILFYRRDQLQEQQADVIKQLSIKMRGLLKVGVAECSEAQAFCREMGIQQVKTIFKLFDS